LKLHAETVRRKPRGEQVPKSQQKLPNGPPLKETHVVSKNIDRHAVEELEGLAVHRGAILPAAAVGADALRAGHREDAEAGSSADEAVNPPVKRRCRN